ncbi:MAG: DUF6483 family protein [Lachnospiraceae bacterium]|nr:DUF6483 family protein [Lachnospiraceae bacterium]
MEYENDLLMRQIRDMARMLASVLFGKKSETYEYEEEKEITTDSLLNRLIHMADDGNINKAENILSDELEKDEDEILQTALEFYEHLNTLSDEFLEKNNYSREEIKEGIQDLAERKGLGVLME